jgi:CRP-like cAMP-binding protein
MTKTADLAVIAARGAALRRLEAGEPLFFEHRSGTEMYAVDSGRIDVLTYGKVLEEVGPGGIVGEMALIDDGPRSAAALAAEPSEVLVISRDLFLTLVREDPAFALYVMSVLAGRLRKR